MKPIKAKEPDPRLAEIDDWAAGADADALTAVIDIASAHLRVLGEDAALQEAFYALQRALAAGDDARAVLRATDRTLDLALDRWRHLDLVGVEHEHPGVDAQRLCETCGLYLPPTDKPS